MSDGGVREQLNAIRQAVNGLRLQTRLRKLTGLFEILVEIAHAKLYASRELSICISWPRNQMGSWPNLLTGDGVPIVQLEV